MKRVLALYLLLFSFNVQMDTCYSQSAKTEQEKQDAKNKVVSFFIFAILKDVELPDIKKDSLFDIVFIGNDKLNLGIYEWTQKSWQNKEFIHGTINVTRIDHISQLVKADLIFYTYLNNMPLVLLQSKMNKDPFLHFGYMLPFNEPMLNFGMNNNKLGFHINESYFNKMNYEVSDILTKMSSDQIKVNTQSEWEDVVLRFKSHMIYSEGNMEVSQNEFEAIIDELDNRKSDLLILENRLLNKEREYDELMKKISAINQNIKASEEKVLALNQIVLQEKNNAEKFKFQTEQIKSELSEQTLLLKNYEVEIALKSEDVKLFEEKIQIQLNELKSLENEVSDKKKIINQNEIDIQSQKAKVYTFLILSFFLLIVLLLVFKNYRDKKIANKELGIQKEIIELKHKEITDSINYAERIQRSFLASTEFLDEQLTEHFVFFKPKDVVSGDFYWSNKLSNGEIALCCADSTGHGVPGAIMSILNISSLEKAIEKEVSPELILARTREIIIERLKKDGSRDGGKDGMDCALIALNRRTNIMKFALANNPLFLVRNNEIIEYKGDKIPVGKHDKDSESFTLHQVELKHNDKIYLITDGFSDQFGGINGKKYMIKNLRSLLLSISKMNMQEQKDRISKEFESWKGVYEQIDDVCIIGFNYITSV
jgi:serine phosphatase RsbU (regulator of sigma subunit)